MDMLLNWFMSIFAFLLFKNFEMYQVAFWFKIYLVDDETIVYFSYEC